MPISTYTYPFTSFPNTIIAKDALYDEVNSSSITIALQSIDNDLTDVFFNFKAALSGAEVIVLNAIVAAHQGIPLTDTITVIQGSSGSIPWPVMIPSGSITYVTQTSGSVFSITGTVHLDNSILTTTGSVTVNNFPVTQSVKIDQTITLPVSLSNTPLVTITNPVTTASISNLPVTQSVFVGSSITLPVSVSNTVSVTGSLSALVTFPSIQNVSVVSSSVTQSITGSVSINNLPVTQSVFLGGSSITLPVSLSNTPLVTITNPVTTASISNLPLTQSVKIDQTITLPVSISNTPIITGSVTINNPTVLPITQSVFIGGSGIIFNVSMSNTPIVTISNPVTTASISNLPLTQSVKIDQSISLPVSLSNTPFVTITNPVTTASISNLPVTQSIFVGGTAITLPVSVSNTVTVTGSVTTTLTLPTTQSFKLVDIGTDVTQSITGSVFVINQPVTQSVFIGGSGITFAVSMSNTPLVTITNPVTTASISNLPLTQSVKIDQTITLPVSVSNTVTVTGSVATTIVLPATQSFKLVDVGTNITQSITGSVFVINLPTTQSVKIDQTITLPVSLSNTPLVTITNPVTTASISNLPLTQSVKIDQSITLPVSVSNTVTVTGSVATTIVFPTTQSFKLVDVGTNITQSITGSVFIINLPTTQSVFLGGSNTILGISMSNTPFVTITNPVLTASISNLPLTQSVKIDQTITLPVSLSNTPLVTITNPVLTASISNLPLTQSVKIDQSITLPVSVSNTVTVTGSVLTTVVFPATQSMKLVDIGTDVTQSITGSVFVINFPTTQSVFLGGSAIALNVSMSNTPFVTITNPVTTASISNLPLTQSVKIDQSITLPVSISNQIITQSVYLASGSSGFNNTSPLWITGSVTTGGSSGGTVIQGASGSLPWKIEIIQSGSAISDINALYVRPTRYNATSFGQTRTVSPYTLVDNVNKYGFDSIEYSTSSVGSGTLANVLSESAMRLTVGTGSTDKITLRSNTYYRYQAGKEQIIKISAYNADTGKTNQIRTWGYGDDNDGLFYCVSGTNFGVLRKSSTSGIVVETFTTQSSFNIDKLDGTGASGLILDVTKANIYETHFQWLGVGYVGMYVNSIAAHVFNFPNTLTVPYMKTATLPLQFEVKNNGVSISSGFTYICSAVESDGGTKPPEFTFGAYTPSDLTIGTTDASLIAIRPGTAFRSVENRTIVIPTKLNISTEGSRASYKVILNPTITGTPLWISASSNNSSVEYTTSSLAYSGGEVLFRGFLPNSNDSQQLDFADFFQDNGRKLRLSAFATSQDVLLIVGQDEAAGSTIMRTSINWKEIR